MIHLDFKNFGKNSFKKQTLQFTLMLSFKNSYNNNNNK